MAELTQMVVWSVDATRAANVGSPASGTRRRRAESVRRATSAFAETRQ